MSKTKLEYIWLDGYKPTQSLRSKTKIVKNFNGNFDQIAQYGHLTVVQPNKLPAIHQTVC